MDISKIDKNYQTNAVEQNAYRFYTPDFPAFVLEGLPFRSTGGPYLRLPQDLLPAMREEMQMLAHHTSGAVLRFHTDSRNFAITAENIYLSGLNHMARFGECGFDLYCRLENSWQFLHNFTAAPDTNILSESWQLPDGLSCNGDYMIYFPLYSGVQSFQLGLPPDASLTRPQTCSSGLPILFYGSSITQGACASRPGCCYPALVCRALDMPFINFGFSGNARGDLEIADLVGKLSLSAFVMDYDYNAPNPAFLAQTHEPFFQAVRRAQPNLPVLLLSRVTAREEMLSDTKERLEIIRRTYDHAVAAGDTNVYLLNGLDFWNGTDRPDCTLDCCHPNDLGFSLMAQHILPMLQEILKTGQDGAV